MEDKDSTTVKGSKAANRSAMPTVAAMVDELRAQGLSPKVIFARENGVTVGVRQRYSEVFQIPLRYGVARAK